MTIRRLTIVFLLLLLLASFAPSASAQSNGITGDLRLDVRGNGGQQTYSVPIQILLFLTVLTFIPAIGDFVTPDLLGGASTTTIAKVVQELFLEGRDWPYGSALGFILIGVTLVGTLIALRNVRREMIGE